ncbi:RHS repeat domain-containing protein [Stenotrophomonas bentonitica]
MFFTLLDVFLVLPAGAQTVTYIHTDALGSIVAESDASGTVIEHFDYEPYGTVLGGQVVDGPGYAGHVSDSATGLSYMQQRYMDPQLGVFLSVDPINASSGVPEFFNRYKYAANNPFKFTDPDGRCAKVTGSNICGGSGVANAMLATSARSPMDIGARQESGAPTPAKGSGGPVVAAKKSAENWKVTSVFTGDTTPTFTYAAAAGVGGKAELKEGPDNDRYSIITPALGGSASGTWNLFTTSYDFMPSKKSAPVDSGLNVGGELGLIGVLGASFRYTPPAKFELSVNGGLGAAARVEMYEVGLTPGKLP